MQAFLETRVSTAVLDVFEKGFSDHLGDGPCSPDFWLNAQRAVDLWEAEQSIGKQVERIKPLRVA